MMPFANPVPARPFLWEASYPDMISWDAPVPTASLGEFLARSVRRHADRTAIVYGNASITYRALGEMVLRMASALARMPEARDGVALLLPNTPYHTIAAFGGASAGLRVVQLSPLDAVREIAHKLRDSGARVLVTLAEPDLLARAAEVQAMGLVDRLVVADDAFWEGASPLRELPEGAVPVADLLAVPPLPAPVEVGAAEVAVLQYTGGTTGLPKGAALTHANITAAAEISAYWQTVRRRDPSDPDRTLMLLPLFHAFAFTMMNRHLGHGNTVVLRRRFDADQCLDDLERHAITVFHGVPTMWIALANHPDIATRDLSALSLPTSGGAPLPVEVAATFGRLTGLRIYSGWGMSEAAAIGCQHSPGGEIRAGSIGMPLPGIELQVVDMKDPQRVLAPGRTGEIRMRGPNLFPGYWNRPEETAASFRDGWFLTGDVGHMDRDGFVFLTDRKKDMILSGGFNVYPRTIEEAIYEHPHVAECIVIGIPDSYRGQAAKAFVALRTGADAFTLEELRAFLASRLGRHELPQALEIRESLPRTSVGKLSKLVLQEEEAACAAAERS